MMKYFSPVKIGLLFFALSLLFLVTNSFSGPAACAITYKTEHINGSSLTGFAENRDKIVVAYGYYECEAPQRGDVVIYADAGSANPLIKMVKAVGGDSFLLARAEGGSKIVVNGEVLRTVAGEPYRIQEDAVRLLELYEKDYQERLPPEAILILGNIPSGSRDSTQFGLISRGSLLGKVVEIVPHE